MRGAIAAVLAALLAVPLRASAADDVFPRVVRRPGKVCVQTLGQDGRVEEACRRASEDWTGDEGRKEPPPEAREIIDFRPDVRPANPPLQARRVDPAAVARADADKESASGYFGGGLLGGCLLGVVGCGGITALGLASDPVPPRAGAFETQEEEVVYLRTYQSEVRNKRALNAVLGGLVGTAIAGLIIYAALNSAGEP